ncbi:MAG: hypothetical protein ABF289_05075, partial [Clostridiales bacterium]
TITTFKSTYCNDKSLNFEINVGYNGIAKIGYAPVEIIFNNKTEYDKFKLKLIHKGENDKILSYSWNISLNSNKNDKYIFYMPIKSTDKNLEVELIKDNKVYTKKTYKFKEILKPQNPVIGVISNEKEKFWNQVELPLITTNIKNHTEFILDKDEKLNTKTFYLEKDDKVFNDVKAFYMYDVIVMNDFEKDFFTVKNYEALKKWVKDGGILLIGTGKNPFESLEKLDSTFRLIEFNDSINVSNYKDSDSSNNNIYMNMFIGNIVKGEVLEYEDKNPLVVNYNMGNGSVMMTTFDINTYKKDDVEGKTQFLVDMISNNKYKFDNENVKSGYNFDGLKDILSIIPFELKNNFTYLIAFVFLYGITIGLVLIVFFRNKDNRVFMIATIPIVTIIATSVILYLGYNRSNKNPIVNIVSVAQYDNYGNKDNSNIELNSYFTTLNNDYDLNVKYGTNADISFVNKDEENTIDGKKVNENKSFYEESKNEIIKEDAELWEKEYAIGAKDIKIGNLNCESNFDNGKNDLNITLTNNTNTDLDNSFIVINEKLIKVGNIKNNEVKNVIIDMDNNYHNLEKYLKTEFPYNKDLDKENSSFNNKNSKYTKKEIENKKLKNIFEFVLKNNSIINKKNLAVNEFLFVSNTSDNYWDDIEINDVKPESFNTNVIYAKFKYAIDLHGEMNISDYDIKYFDEKYNLIDGEEVNIYDGKMEVKNPFELDLLYSNTNKLAIDYFEIKIPNSLNSVREKYKIYNYKKKLWEDIELIYNKNKVGDYVIMGQDIRIRLDMSKDEIYDNRYIELPQIFIQGEYKDD